MQKISCCFRLWVRMKKLTWWVKQVQKRARPWWLLLQQSLWSSNQHHTHNTQHKRYNLGHHVPQWSNSTWAFLWKLDCYEDWGWDWAQRLNYICEKWIYFVLRVASLWDRLSLYLARKAIFQMVSGGWNDRCCCRVIIRKKKYIPNYISFSSFIVSVIIGGLEVNFLFYVKSGLF